jgi:radical SAM/Cys-rich protein
MPDAVVEACLVALANAPECDTLDVTGGAPELHPRFREIVQRARGLGRRTIVRHNLTVQHEPGQQDLPEFFAACQCEIVASLPHYTEDATDRQRGRGVYEKSIAGLLRLNAVGYGTGQGQVLNLVSNPVGAFLPPRQQDLERDMRLYLGERHRVVFDHLFTITNMPIARFGDWLDQHGRRAEYLERLESAFNPATLPGLMCRSLVSVAWDGRLFDCDFNQMLELSSDGGAPASIFGLDLRQLAGRRVRTADHCLGCTAGAGSSCGGALT